MALPKKGTILQAAASDHIVGEVVDLVAKVSGAGNPYKDIVFATGETIAMPFGHKLKAHFVAGDVYDVEWDAGILTIIAEDGTVLCGKGANGEGAEDGEDVAPL